MGLSLYEINTEIEALTDILIDEETGEINEEVLQKLEQLDIDLDEKLESYGVVIKNLTAEIDALTAEKKALTRRIEVRANRITRMSEIVNRILKGKKKRYDKVEYSYRQSSSVNVVNEDLVPDELCNLKVSRNPMKTEIKKLLKKGHEVPGCVLEEKNNLLVK